MRGETLDIANPLLANLHDRFLDPSLEQKLRQGYGGAESPNLRQHFDNAREQLEKHAQE